MSQLQKLIDSCWFLIENNMIDGDMLPNIDECQDELNKYLPCNHDYEYKYDSIYQRKILKCKKCNDIP